MILDHPKVPVETVFEAGKAVEVLRREAEDLTNNLAQTVSGSNSAMSTEQIYRSNASSDANMKAAINNAFGAGPLTITYVGHGAEDIWAGSAVFGNSDADALNNNSLPVVLALNCLNALYYDPDPTFMSLGEKLIFNPNGGAVAFVGSTTMTSPSAQTALAQAFFTSLSEQTSNGVKTLRLGDVFLTAKQTLGINNGTKDAVKSYTILGDPAMRFPSNSFTTPPSPTDPPSPPPPSGGGGGGSGGGGGGGCGFGVVASQNFNPGPGGPGAAATVAILLMPLLLVLSIRLRLARRDRA